MQRLMSKQVGMDLLPEAQANLGWVIQEPIPENFVKFFIKHISSAVLLGFQFGFAGLYGLWIADYGW